MTLDGCAGDRICPFDDAHRRGRPTIDQEGVSSLLSLLSSLLRGGLNLDMVR
jgi:hypothetical protein